MSFGKLLTVFLIMLFLSGCFATTKKYEAVLRSWVSSSEDELISSWGVPDSFYEAGGKRYLTYSNSRSGYVPGTPPTMYTTSVYGNTGYTTAYGGTSGFSYNNHCKTTFTVVDGKITSWTWKGNSCTSK